MESLFRAAEMARGRCLSETGGTPGWRPYDAAKIQPYGYDRYLQTVRGSGYRFSVAG